MIRSNTLLAMLVRLVGSGTLALLAACSTTRLPDAPKTLGSTVKANPHYKVGAPYQIDGRWYTPKVEPDYVETGVASWYGDAFHGKLTANGEIFDKRRISAAHRTLPMPTVVEVENLQNGRRIVVRVNDRGPFAKDRIIDLSHGAADALGFTAQGTAQVRVRYLGEANLADLAPLPGRQPRMRAIAATPAAGGGDAMASLIASTTGAPAGAAAPVTTTELWVEVAQVTDAADLQRMRLYIPGEGPMALHSASDGGRALQSLRLGPFVSEASAAASLSRARKAGFGSARIVYGAGN
jgi:rare lipoprotein A